MELRLTVQSGNANCQEVVLRRFPVLIGRKSRANFRITSRMVSREHCIIEERDGWLMVRDLGSSNGTYVNNIQLVEEAVLRPGDKLGIGSMVFEASYNPAQASFDPMMPDVIHSGLDDDIRPEATLTSHENPFAGEVDFENRDDDATYLSDSALGSPVDNPFATPSTGKRGQGAATKTKSRDTNDDEDFSFELLDDA